jgi:hypothetical protein
MHIPLDSSMLLLDDSVQVSCPLMRNVGPPMRCTAALIVNKLMDVG